MKHTPTPWKAGSTAIFGDINVDRPFNIVVADCEVEEDHHERNEANAAFIVKAVNAHDELVAALRGAVKAAHTAIESRTPSEFWDTAASKGLMEACEVLSKLEGGAK